MDKAYSTADIAIVFGAGASIPPLRSQQELVRDILSTTNEPRISSAQKYLRRTFPGLIKTSIPNNSIRFEDIVGPLEIAESEEYWYHFGGHKFLPKKRVLVTNKEVLDSLDTWVAIALDPECVPKPPGSKKPDYALKQQEFLKFYAPSESATLSYAKLVYFLKKTKLLDKTVFLSMNYDILLDRVLYASETHAPDYKIDAFYDVPEPFPSKKQPSGVRLLKLHGSLNWRACDRCHVLRNLKGFVAWPNSKCVDCESEAARPMLIRPTLLKDFRHRVWQDVWREAGHVLASASKWVFVGYSLPMADVWMLRLLAQSAMSWHITPVKRSITVVNTDADVMQRFTLLFPNAEFRNQSFDAWVVECQNRGGIA